MLHKRLSFLQIDLPQLTPTQFRAKRGIAPPTICQEARSRAVTLHTVQSAWGRRAVARGWKRCGAKRDTRDRISQEAAAVARSSAAEQKARLDSHSQAGFSGRSPNSYHATQLLDVQPVSAQPVSTRDWQFLAIGAALALAFHVAAQWAAHLPVWQRVVRRFIWWKDSIQPDRSPAGDTQQSTTALTLYNDNAESVEWFNMCWRKMWRVYQRGLERWLADLLQPVFDNLVAEVAVPRFVQRLRILEFTLDHEAPTFSQMRRRSSRKDSDLNGVVNVRYTGGARLLLLIEVGQGRWRFKLPVLVSDLDLECKLWIKLRLAPMTPYVGTISLAFVGPPTIKVQLLPYNHVRLMRIPVLQPFLSKLLTVDLPNLMVLPKRLEINIPPAVTAVAEAAVGHDAVMRAVASAVLQADALEHALIAALPLGPQSAAGGISLPESFHGELQVTLLEARNLPVWGFPWQSNPYCRLILGSQAVRSRRDDDTSHAGRHREPVWNQEFQFLVEDPLNQMLEVHVRDSHLTGRADLGYVKFPLRKIPSDGHISSWLAVQPWTPTQKAEGELHLKLTYKPFEDDEASSDTGYREAEAYAMMLQEQAITDIKSAADASSRAAVAASAAAAAVAVTKAAAARAAAKAALSAKARARQKRLEAAAEQELSKKRLDSRGGRKERLAVLGSGDRQALEADGLARSMAAAVGSAGVETDESLAGDQQGQPEGSKSALDPLALQDISPEDLFPPVSFSISDRADEDMPYIRPSEEPAESKVSTKDTTDSKSSSRDQENGVAAFERQLEDGDEQPLHSSNGTGTPRRQELHAAASSSGAPKPARLSSDGDVADMKLSAEAQFDRRRAEYAAGLELGSNVNSGDDLPLILSTLENATLQEALSQDVDAAEVIEAVAQGDIKPLTDAKYAKLSAGEDRAPPSIGRGAFSRESGPPSRVDAGMEVTGDEASSATIEAQRSGIDDGKPSIRLNQVATPAARKPTDIQEQGPLKRFLAHLPFWGAKDTEEDRSQAKPVSEAERTEATGEAEDESWFAKLRAAWPISREREDGEESRKRDEDVAGVSVDDDTIKDVMIANDLQLEDIADEVRNSWRLKEIRAEALMQKAVARSDRPWLILLSSVFTSTVVLLGLVLYRLYNLNSGNGGGGLD